MYSIRDTIDFRYGINRYHGFNVDKIGGRRWNKVYVYNDDKSISREFNRYEFHDSYSLKLAIMLWIKDKY